MTLDEWDLKVAPVLRELETRAAEIRVKAARLELELDLLKFRPNFQTKFEVELLTAMQQLDEIIKKYWEKDIE